MCSIFIMQKNIFKKINPPHPPKKKSENAPKANEMILLFASLIATLRLTEGAPVHISVSPSSITLKCKVEIIKSGADPHCGLLRAGGTVCLQPYNLTWFFMIVDMFMISKEKYKIHFACIFLAPFDDIT